MPCQLISTAVAQEHPLQLRLTRSPAAEPPRPEEHPLGAVYSADLAVVFGRSSSGKMAQQPVQPVDDRRATGNSAGMLTDEYVLAALSTFSGSANTNLASLALGSDLSLLGVDMSSPQSLHRVFAGQRVEPPRGRLNEPDFRFPCEYVITQGIMETLGDVKLNRHREDLPPVYTFAGDASPVLSATELHKRLALS